MRKAKSLKLTARLAGLFLALGITTLYVQNTPIKAKADGHSTHCVCLNKQSTEAEHNTNPYWKGINNLSNINDEANYYYLTEDTELSGSWHCYQKKVNLCLNGHVIKMNGNQIAIEENCNLTICDCKLDTSTHTYKENSNGVWVLDANGDKTVSGGAITGCSNGNAINNSGILNLYDCNIIGNACGSSVIYNKSVATIYGGKIYGNNGGNNCTIIENSDHLYLNDCDISYNTANSGIINMQTSRGQITMYSGTVSNNKSHWSGGVTVDRGTFIMNGGAISNNTCTDQPGGGVNIHYGTFIMNGGAISQNTANGNGGGIYNREGSFTMNGGSISENVAKGNGGGVYNHEGSFTMNGGSIVENSATENGGGIASNVHFSLNGGSISDNYSSKNGGGIYCKVDTSFTLKDTIISNNVADNGGGVYVLNDATDKSISLKNISLFNNVANEGGGAYFAGGTAIMVNSFVFNNTASSNGGGVYNDANLIVGGGIRIIENSVNCLANNVYLPSGKTITLGSKTTLEEGNGVPTLTTYAHAIGITMQEGSGIFTEAKDNIEKYAGYFISDVDILLIEEVDGENKLQLNMAPKQEQQTTNSNENGASDSAHSLIPVYVIVGVSVCLNIAMLIVVVLSKSKTKKADGE